MLADIHGGDYGHHSYSWTLIGKTFRIGFYWRTTLNDTIKLVKACEACQFHAKQIHQPAQGLQTIHLSWPFAVWGLDILGPFPRAPGGYRYLYVAVDKFTKWIEAKPINKLNGPTAVTFITDITSRYNIPRSIITDNGTNIAKGALARFCVT